MISHVFACPIDSAQFCSIQCGSDSLKCLLLNVLTVKCLHGLYTVIMISDFMEGIKLKT